jgi:hypothetical protein
MMSHVVFAHTLQHEPEAELDPAYRQALARTRQATAALRALGFLHAGSRPRAWAELRRALHEHSTCHAPLEHGTHSIEELATLYRLALEETAHLPNSFSVILQLRCGCNVSLCLVSAC